MESNEPISLPQNPHTYTDAAPLALLYSRSGITQSASHHSKLCSCITLKCVAKLLTLAVIKLVKVASQFKCCELLILLDVSKVGDKHLKDQ